MPGYQPKQIEPKWQSFWVDQKIFKTTDSTDKPKYYILDMFPYPSGSGLHVGHPEGYTATDILARYKRMQGFNVLHPMGWDAFGLPAEQYAVETNTHPAITTKKNIDTFRKQIQMLGFSYDWDREVNTTDPDYYRWTQWIFLQLYNTWYDPATQKGRPISELPIPDAIKQQGVDAITNYQNDHRLAYLSEAPVNWCAALGTVLANEEVIDGKSERGGHPVIRLPLKQWMLRITKYAERLLADLDDLDWPNAIKEMQRDWIGKSEGAEVDFPLIDDMAGEEDWDAFLARRAQSGFPATPADDVIRVYTTRPDTLFGATYMVLAPEHPLVERITTPGQKKAVEEYRQKAAGKSDLERTHLSKEKTGVFTGAYALNPVTKLPIPVWIADYVLVGYGTGAIMAVPAHDQRDWEFAEKFELDIKDVVADPNDMNALLTKAYRWIGDWERSVDRSKDDRYLSVALLLNCGFDLDGFKEDQKDSKKDPLWQGVQLYFDETDPRGLIVSYLDPEFEELLEQYITEQEDTQAIVLNEDPNAGCGPDCDDPTHDHGDDDDDEMYDDDADDADDVDGYGADLDLSDEELAELDSLTAYEHEGFAIRSGFLTGLPTAEAKKYITDRLQQMGMGAGTVKYKLRDWLFSRQRYWGEPFPVVHADGQHYALDASELPITLPELADFKPTGTPEPPLSKATDWVNTTYQGKAARREINTMPQWAGSCWYYLRFIDPQNDGAFVDRAKEKYWMPVDLYVGGAEHAVLHLLYSRFWHKVLFDLGYVSSVEPFKKLFNQGIILGEPECRITAGQYEANRDILAEKNIIAREFQSGDDAFYVLKVPDSEVPGKQVDLPEEMIEKRKGTTYLTGTDIAISLRADKMSKARGNVVNPVDVINEYGADSLRLFEMFMGPLEAVKPWSTKGVEGLWRFLARVWRLMVDEAAETITLSPTVKDIPPTREQERLLHQTIRGVTQDLEAMRFNTAISKLMEFTNALMPVTERPRALLEPFVLLLAPFAPHLAEELWELLGHTKTLAYEPWPTFDESKCQEDAIEVVVQINNKVKAKLSAKPDANDDELIKLAKGDEKVQGQLAGKQIVKSFVIASRQGKLVNFVVK